MRIKHTKKRKKRKKKKKCLGYEIQLNIIPPWKPINNDTFWMWLFDVHVYHWPYSCGHFIILLVALAICHIFSFLRILRTFMLAVFLYTTSVFLWFGYASNEYWPEDVVLLFWTSVFVTHNIICRFRVWKRKKRFCAQAAGHSFFGYILLYRLFGPSHMNYWKPSFLLSNK